MNVKASNNNYQTSPVRTQIGQIEVIRYHNQVSPQCADEHEHIRQDNVDCIALCLPLATEFVLQHGYSLIRLQPGHFCFVATNRPFVLKHVLRAEDEHYDSVYLRFPGPLIRRRLLCVDDLCFRTFPISPGAGNLMQKVIKAALEESNALSESAAAGLEGMLLDVVGNAAQWAADIGHPRLLSRQLSHQRIYEKAVRFIDANLSNHTLGTTLIADNCRVSVRYLHAAFATFGETAAGHVREKRLQTCHAALTDPSLVHHSVARISSDWGFQNLSHFSRVFRHRFGYRPTMLREEFRQVSKDSFTGKKPGLPGVNRPGFRGGQLV